MRNSPINRNWVCLVVLLSASALAAQAADRGPLQVGVARVDITPPANAALPLSGYFGPRTKGFERIHDHIYVRAIVLSDGTSLAGVLAGDLGQMPTPMWADLSQRIAREVGIPAQNLLLSATHDHSSVVLADTRPFFQQPPAGRPPTPQSIAYTRKVENDAVEAFTRAKANLRPAQFGFGTGKAYVNINRREFFPQKGTWGLGYNAAGPSDKTVAVLKFADLAGKPIALFINYGVHGVVMGTQNLALTGDLPGATSRYVEQYYQGKIPTRSDAGWELGLHPDAEVAGDGPVAVWTSGPGGDQNPVAMDMGEDFTMVDALGKMLGEESVRVANSITQMSSTAKIIAAQRVVTCPGRKLAADNHPPDYKFEDADPISIRLSLLRLNDVALAGVSAEVFTRISERLKRESPLNHTVMVTCTNGSEGYIPDDAAFDQISYEIAASRFKPGCAENGIVKGFLEMLGAR